jgi:hypothetical protein
MNKLSPDQRKIYHDLRAAEKDITDPRVRAIANKHRRTWLVMHSSDGPALEDAVKAQCVALEELAETPCGCDDVFFQKEDYLTTCISVLDPADNDFHCVLDAVLAYLSERQAA